MEARSMYAHGDGVPRDDSKAYYYFNQLVADYDEDQPGQQDETASQMPLSPSASIV